MKQRTKRAIGIGAGATAGVIAGSAVASGTLAPVIILAGTGAGAKIGKEIAMAKPRKSTGSNWAKKLLPF